MKQKLALACALIHDPDLLILDEPTAGVDPVSRQELWKILKTAVAQKGMSVLVSTAYLEEVAMCHDVYIINKGVILAKGTPEMLTEPYKDRVYFAQSEGERRAKCSTPLPKLLLFLIPRRQETGSECCCRKMPFSKKQQRNSVFRL